MSGWPPPPPVPFPFAFPPRAFDNLISWAGIQVLWMKGHACPCVGDTGASNPTTSAYQQCPVCFGRGVYWDPPAGPFTILLTFITWMGRNVDIGQIQQPDYGLLHEGTPIITIPETAGILWQQASEYDAYVETQSSMRFNTVLRVNESTVLPAWHFSGLEIAPTGAVVVEDPNTSIPTSGVAYTTSGLNVILTGSYPNGTAYTVEYTSSPVFIAFQRFGGLPHVRPFQGLSYPRRFKVQILDLFFRDKLGSSLSVADSSP